MADLTILTLAGGETASISGGYIYVIRPAATPSGFQDYRISITNLLLSVNNKITDNKNDIDALEIEVDALQNLGSKVRLASVAASTTFNQPAYSDIYLMYFIWVSGTPVISIGTTPGGTDIVNGAEPLSGVMTVHDNLIPSATSRTLHLTISGGVVHFVRYLRQNINS